MTVIQQLIKQLKKKSASTDYGPGAALPGGLGAFGSNRAGWVAEWTCFNCWIETRV